jgi:hypothetical protein
MKINDTLTAAQPSARGRYLTDSRRLRLDNWVCWPHHKGGWKHVLSLIAENLHAADGTRFVSAVEDELFSRGEHYSGPIKEPWVGFVHQVPRQNYNFPDLERLVRMDSWKQSIEHCRGLWVLTDYQKNYLKHLGVQVPIAKVLYPVVPPAETFSFEKFLSNPRRRLIFIGEFLRNYQAFFDLQAPSYDKTFLRSAEIDKHMRKLGVVENDSVFSLYEVDDEEYDRLLTNNIVYLNLFDAVGTTTVTECIAGGTPVLINKVGAVTEYLGEDYPFYYETPEEATEKASDLDLIRRTTEYLRAHELRERLTDEHFLESLQNTSVYRSLPVPPSQQRQFKSFDLSLIICSYKRVYNLERLLTLLTEQDFEGTFEVLVWNNNIEALDEVADICRRFEHRLALKVIHSNENFYCQIRMAMASLIRSDLLLICDDDVLPQPGYVSTFLNKYREYGPEAVVCARGHVFLPHEIDEEEPQRFWEDFEHMKFYNEDVPDRRVHFMHADNCLIPKSVMKRAIQHEMERYEYALIDDYWLSYIVSAELGIPVWKIKAGDALRFTQCADDPSIALFHNVLVSEQRVNFYLAHTRKGWPASDEFDDALERAAAPQAQAPVPPQPKVSDIEQLALDVFNREAVINPVAREGFFLRLSAALVTLPHLFVSEDAPRREALLVELRDLIARYRVMSLDYDELWTYLTDAERHLAHLATEPTPERSAWRDEELSAHAQSVPSMLFPETRRYYKWLGRRLDGSGDVVELGSWLGSATTSLADGIAANPSFVGRRLYAYDSFVWERWMDKYLPEKLRAAHPALQTLKLNDDYTNLFLEYCAPYRDFVEARKCYVQTSEGRGLPLPLLEWGGGPVELFIYDLGHEYDLISQAWQVFAPSFIPGKTVVVFNPYGNMRAEELRRFCREHGHELRPLHKPASSTKGFLFTGAAGGRADSGGGRGDG